MSMWLELAKIEPSLLEEMREKPELIHTVFFSENDSAPLPGGLRRVADFYGYDYRTLSAIAEGRAEAEKGTADWRDAYPWLARATGDHCDVIAGYEFCYGPAFVLTPNEVRQVTEGLVAEGWVLGTTVADWDEENEDDEFEDLCPYFAAAAAEGKAVIGGVS
ncbi:hypothetical protein [Nocardia sp. bgisy134]|uniref:hypothetical protein n=1 Tax=unclassified Nocardia TaxID=2637762 RepID=UPI003D728E88